MDNNEFMNNLITYRLLDPIWQYVSNNLLKTKNVDDELLKIFSMYFSFISSGSSCMPIDKKSLFIEWKNKCDDNKILLTAAIDDEDTKEEIISNIDKLCECGFAAIDRINELSSLVNLVGDDKLFIIYNNFLYARKYYQAKEGIKNSINRLFVNYVDDSNISFEVEKIWETVSKEQKSFVDAGIKNNLILCGGPGTGKTTAVFYLLLALLKAHSNYNIYLTAPSGKASARIKESINGEINSFNDKNKDNHEYDNEIKLISQANSYTIHKLLETDYKTNSFIYNENNQFSDHSIFIIDEASMIDVCLFDSLLKAIPNGARVFILGDKHQLPSVECGAVLADLISNADLSSKRIELTVSHRFVEGSMVYKLSKEVNDGNITQNIIWKSLDDFKIVERLKPKDNETKTEKRIRQMNSYPVYYYDVSMESTKTFKDIISEWGIHFYKESQALCKGIEFNAFSLDSIYKTIDEARVLCAENAGKIGVSTINSIIKDKVVDKSYNTNIKGFYPGMPLMITENNKELNLNNGDTGILVTFKDSDILFFLIEKENEKYPIDSTTIEDKILKLGRYMLYPLRMLDSRKIIYAYAITIHKSQGSGYNNILVVLPTKYGHPLLNRQIIYTGITRTKGPTYILSDNSSLMEAAEKVSYRYTNIFD